MFTEKDSRYDTKTEAHSKQNRPKASVSPIEEKEIHRAAKRRGILRNARTSPGEMDRSDSRCHENEDESRFAPKSRTRVRARPARCRQARRECFAQAQRKIFRESA